ncbi:MAG: hypothetical protein AAB647_03380 [Patescibacteria group bacterium]
MIVSRVTGKKGKKNLRDKPRRRGHDRLPASVDFSGTHLNAPRQWIERQIRKVAKSVAQSGEFFDLKTVIKRVARGTFSIILRDSDWGPVSDWSPVTCRVIKNNSQPLERATFAHVPLRFGEKSSTITGIFTSELEVILAGNYLGPLQKEIYLILCVEILEWILLHPVTPHEESVEETQKPT